MKHAFTLSEVLITLLIIGIIAVITIPSFIKSYKFYVLHKQFIKTYSDLNNFASKFQAQEGISFSEYCVNPVVNGRYNRSNTKCFNKLMDNIGEVKRISKEEFESSEFNYELYDGSGNKISKSIGWKTTMCNGPDMAQDLNGRYYIMHVPPYSDGNIYTKGEDGPNGPLICVDINGQKAPNKFGQDYFVFIFTVDNKVIPYGMNDRNNPVCYNGGSISPFNCCSFHALSCNNEYPFGGGNTISCSYWALADKHPMQSYGADDRYKEFANKTYWKDFIYGK